MLDVDYFKLERAVQDRFADSTRAIGMPAPIVRVPPKDRLHLVWFAVGGALALATSYGATLGVGDLQSSIALAPVWVLAALCVSYSLSLFCILMGLARLNRLTGKPYLPGLYLFPVGVIDARGEVLRVARLPEIEEVTVDGTRVSVRSARGGTVVFPLDDAEKAKAVQSAIDEARQLYHHAVSTHNRRELARLDPLIDSGFSSPFSPKMRISRTVPLWQRLAPLIALGFGIFTGLGVWIVRNRLSERALYEAAVSADTLEAYGAYIERGGPRAEVRDLRLPRAELRLAEEAGTVESIEAYLEKNPDSAIDSEIRASLNRALEAELEEAKSKRTVSALRDFAKRRSTYGYIQKPTQDAIDELYASALDDYVKSANPEQNDAREFIEQLLAYAEKHGPTVEVRFVRSIPKSVKQADSVVRRSSYYMGEQSVPSQYFDDEDAKRREDAVLPPIIERLQAPFPEDVLKFKVGEPVAAEEDVQEMPEVDVPTVFILTEPHMSGGYMSRKPRGVFVGLGLKFTVSGVIPGKGEVLKFDSATWRTPDPRILKEDGAKIADVYDAMAEDGYQRFQRKFIDYFFADSV